MKLSKAVAASLPILGGVAFLLASPATAQQPASPHNLSLAPDERTALQALEAAARGSDRAAQDAALANARAAARGAGARHALAHYQLEIARMRQDAQMLGQAVDALVASGLSTPEEMASLLASQATRAYYAGEYPQAERLLARAVELEPNNPSWLAEHAQLKSQIAGSLTRAGRQAEAQPMFEQSVTMLRRAIELHQASGRPAPESWYRRTLAIASERSLGPQSFAVGREMVSAYPTPLNWRDALQVYRQASQADAALDLDIKRLLRATQGLSGERDYLEYATALKTAGLAGAEKAVLDEGVARGMLSASEPVVRQAITDNGRRATAERSGLARLRTSALAAATGASARAAGDQHFGNGQYAPAAELYRAALQKGGEDPGLVNLRLGMALALAGNRPEAEAAFRSVTGPRAELAGFWLVWLARAPAAPAA